MIKPLPNKKAIITMIGIVFVLLYLNAIRVQAQTAPVKNEPVQIGSSDAPIKIEVFYDMQCPSCASFHPVLKATLSKFQNKLYVTFRHFPISFHDKAFISGLAVEAANQQGKGFEMIDMLLSNQNEWAWTPKFRGIIDEYAKKLGLDMVRFRVDMNGSESEIRMIGDMERGRHLKVNSTPTVFLNGRLLSYTEALDLEESILKFLNMSNGH